MNLLVNTGVRQIHARQTGIASLAIGAMAAALLAPPIQAQETGTPPATPGSVNIELILDVSGSMAEPVAGSENQTRMAAAQAALRDVITAIPDGQHINVGLRVYGQEGSNAE